jgi:3-methylcrotonyl-CoA carboxylase beta subunit
MSAAAPRLNTADAEFLANRAASEALVADLRARRRLARTGGPEKARSKHLARGKLLPRDRIDALLDPGSPFLEWPTLAGEGLYEGVPPGASLITGIGLVEGRPCMVIANDATVKGGTYYGMTCRKHVRAQRSPGCTGCRASRWSTAAAPSCPTWPTSSPTAGQFGSIFDQQVRMSAEGIPQIAVVMGPAPPAAPTSRRCATRLVIVRGQGFLYLGGPELTFAATGEQSTPRPWAAR